MDIVDTRTGIRWIEVKDCLRMPATKQVGRIGFVVGGIPEILPVNYVLDGEAVVFATAEGSKLRGVPQSHVVFEADDTDPVSRPGWSVVVHGFAEEVTQLRSAGLGEPHPGASRRPVDGGSQAPPGVYQGHIHHRPGGWQGVVAC